MTAKVEVEFVRRLDSFPADPGTVHLRYALIGANGAVGFLFYDVTGDRSPELNEAIDAIDRQLGHALFPMWADLGSHAAEPPWDHERDACDLMLSGQCYYEGSTLHARRVGVAWEAVDRDPEWLYRYLAGYYHDTFYG